MILIWSYSSEVKRPGTAQLKENATADKKQRSSSSFVSGCAGKGSQTAGNPFCGLVPPNLTVVTQSYSLCYEPLLKAILVRHSA
jgi:hypothetical protein